MTDKKLFLIESGKALELVRSHIAEVIRVRKANAELLEPLAVQMVWTYKNEGSVTAVKFNGAHHADFTKPASDGRSRPKKGTEWAKKFAAQKGHLSASDTIAEALKIPLSIQTLSEDGEISGSRMIGWPLCECGFLYLGEAGPYAMWVPDVPTAVTAEQARKLKVAEPALSFKLEFPGCRALPEEEWDFIVAKHKLEKAQGKAVAA